MRVPQINVSGAFRLGNCTKKAQSAQNFSPFKTNSCDTISFSSTAKYLKKYNTLPDEIKTILSPKEGIEMFRDIELLAQGKVKAHKKMLTNYEKLYKNPWLKNYPLIILGQNEKNETSKQMQELIQHSIWNDNENSCVYLISESI